MKRQEGVGLVEIMISLTLGLMVTGAIIQIYLTTSRQSNMQSSLTGRQETARYAVQAIQGDAQMAGFRGCLRDTGNVNNVLNDSANFLYDYAQHVFGVDDSELGALPASITDVVAGTDVLTLRTVDDPGVFLISQMASSSGNPVLPADLDPEPLADGDIALIADCGGAAIFQVTGFDPDTGVVAHAESVGAPGNASSNLNRKFAAGAQIFTIRTTTYFIRQSEAGTGPALWRRIGLEDPQELAAGIENMQVLYGVNTGGDLAPDVYRRADQIAAGDWDDVVSLQIALLTSGVDDRVTDDYPDDFTFDLLGTAIDPPADGRVRRVVAFTVAMRNRLS